MSLGPSDSDPRRRASAEQLLRELLSDGVEDMLPGVSEDVLDRFIRGVATPADRAELEAAAALNPDLARAITLLSMAETEPEAGAEAGEQFRRIELPVLIPSSESQYETIDWRQEWSERRKELERYPKLVSEHGQPRVAAPSPEPQTAAVSNGREAAFHMLRRWGWPLALAATLLAFCVVFYGQAQAQSDLREMLRDARTKIDELVRRISAAGVGREVPPPSGSAFQDEFERARSFQPRSYPNEPRLGLVFYPFIGPPYYIAVRATWDGNHSQWVYRTGRDPLEPEVVLDFADLTPQSGERRVNLTLEFHTTGEAMRNVDGVGPLLTRRVPLIVSTKGVRVASAGDQNMVTASISTPSNEQAVDDRFVLGMTLQRPAPNAGADSNRMVHVLIRPLDGQAGWRNQYHVVPFRSRVDALAADAADAEKHPYRFPVTLRGMLESILPEERPTRLEVLVVDVPFQLEGWMVRKNVVDFDVPESRPMVRARIVVRLRPNEEETL